MNHFKKQQIQNIADFNPREQLAKGALAKSVPMAMLKEFQRQITGYEIKAFNGGAKFRNGDTLLAKITPCLENGKTVFVDILDDGEVAFGSTEFIVLRAKNETNPEFLYYFAISPDFRKRAIECMEGTSGRQRVNENTLKTLELPIPEPQTQQSIAAVLSALDKKIALNKQINARLEEMAKTLYDYWFVQFDFPDANGKPYKSSGGEMVFDETLKREIPKGWEVKSLGKHITIKRGISYKSNEIKDTGVPFINLNSFYLDGKFKFEGTKFFTGKTKNDDFISSGDLLIAVTDVTRNADIIGKAFILPDLFNNSPVMSCDVAKISSSELNNFYLERLFNSSSYHEYIKYFASGTLVLHLDIKGISWFDTYIPPRMLLDKFEDFCRNIYLRIVETEKQNHRLTQLRDFLLPMLMNGQVSVAE
ncbi:restriction endonuclease subunit S [Neisseria sp. oral taxon 014]|uniref:restriction endonuclease subunit S n=1 Tax=Neisseria sp. oral taxon 014 TaxID=641148 RepID=UPI0025FB1DBC|nr:restriction endonuclease subunit S [Neisseria sp. oral taxon 014]